MDTPNVDAAFQFLGDQPMFAAALGFVLLIALFRGWSKAKKAFNRRGHRPDGARLFTPAQKAEGARRAGRGRCEHKDPMWFRCSKPGTHGDHIYPHSRGGATAMSNLQMLCPTHNLAKSATVPTRTYIWRLERRRARYFPAGVSGKVEWRADRAW
ncbi:HNH endonuclease [Leifsonia sp. Leaf264]|uniref:HNH endonuclease n=1 Tax=Leifsonia sp. Leaf264 TaxID=1736314 RepID=UPI0006FF27AD|nr:HNH endonuclease [Leifsonia sp. Leaf264]KQO98857.1 hypothetical protein ASF30_12405 [Leifsonia sp. Leaf264]